MRVVRTFVIFVTTLAVTAAPARAQFGGIGFLGMLNRASPAISLDLPAGELAKIANTGFGVAIRTSAGRDRDEWGVRGIFGFERFGGKAPLLNVQYLSYGLEIVHRSDTGWYQYGGFALYNGRFNYDPNVPLLVDPRVNSNDAGLSGGVGVNFGNEAKAHTFLEFGAVNVFTDRSNDVWFPIRFGLKF